MLHARAAVEVDVLLDLRLALPRRGLVDRHLDALARRGHDDGPERREVGADVLVVDGPEAVEAEDALVVPARRVHLAPVLVADAVVDSGERHLREEGRDRIGRGVLGTVTRQEDAGVAAVLDERVRRVAVRADRRRPDAAEGVGDGLWR